jgi:ribosome maturation factor RimP
MDDALEREIEARIEALGFELVELERAGARGRPILRVRADRPDAGDGLRISLDECARISRALEDYLDAAPEVPEKYVLEVSSPGLERPLVRRRDFERFVGREVTLRGAGPLAGRSRRLEGELLGVVDGERGEMIRLRLSQGEEIAVPREEITRANLVFRWNE